MTCGLGTPGERSGPENFFAPGELLAGRYEIIRLLGWGGMATVFQAWDRETLRVVAMKVLRRERANSRVFLQRFKRECLLARRIHHPNVVQIYELGATPLVRFLTMEMLDGESLNAVLDRRNRLPLNDALGIALQVCKGLAAAHACGVVHRDLSPKNIMVESRGRVVVTDFGLAVDVDGRGITNPGETLGTPRYMPPEQAMGRPADERSDIFGLGLILHEMITGGFDYRPRSIMRLLMERATVEMSVLPGPLVPAAVAGIISRCIRIIPEQRYQSAAELAKDLEGSLESRSSVH